MPELPYPKKLGRYLVLRELGNGAMGCVYEAKDPQLNRRVAVKTARRELVAGPGGSPDLLERFFREARVAGMLNHPNIVTVHDAGEQDGTAFIAMEYVEGTDLGARMANGPRFSPTEAAELAATLSEALAYAHDRGVVHRDIKPANILLPFSGAPKLADFGIAHVIDSTLTQDGALIGTPTCMSPEQFMGQRVDGRSDLFSLGVVLYEMLTGERPFTGAAFSTIMHRVLNTEPVAPHELNFSVNRALSHVVMTVLSKAPQDRFPDGRTFALALRRAAAGALTADRDARGQMTPANGVPQDDPAVLPQPDTSQMDTIPGPPPPDVVSPDADDYPAATITAAMAAKRAPARDLTLPGALLALLGLLAIAYFLYPRPQTPGESPQNPSAIIAPSDPVDQTRLRVSVYATAQDVEYFHYQQLVNGQGDTEAYIREAEATGRVQLLRGAGYSIRVSDPLHSSKPFATEALTEDGYALLQLPGGASTVKFEVYSDKTSLLTMELPAEACQRPQKFLVLCPNCVLAPSPLSGTSPS